MSHRITSLGPVPSGGPVRSRHGCCRGTPSARQGSELVNPKGLDLLLGSIAINLGGEAFILGLLTFGVGSEQIGLKNCPFAGVSKMSART